MELFGHQGAATSDILELLDEFKAAHKGKRPRVEASTMDPDWVWPTFEHWYEGEKWWIDEKARVKKTKYEEDENENECPFEVVTSISHGGDPSVYIRLYSTKLIQIMETCKQVHHTGEISKGKLIDSKLIFLARHALQERYQSVDREDSTESRHIEKCHVKHLLSFMEQEFKDTLVLYERMKREGSVSWDMLWAFLVPNEEVCRRCRISGHQCCATVSHGSYKRNCAGAYFNVSLNVMDYNIHSYRKCKLEYTINAFDGEVSFTSLAVCPLYFFPDREQMESMFVERGSLFYRSAMEQPFLLMQYKGSMEVMDVRSGNGNARKLNADGRVMVDLLNFTRRNPHYNHALGNAEPPYDLLSGKASGGYHDTGMRKKPSEEELRFAPAVVFGFSFRLKQWGCFEVCGLQDVRFNEGAFDALEMRNADQKELLRSLVMQYVAEKPFHAGAHGGSNIDFISKKGEGCIVLCHGPPGTGKTLTAEALAETLHRPLWSMSAFELGNNPCDVEDTMCQIMDIAYTWRCILLLDEADAYLERRGEGIEVTRNLMTGVFLRILEYYRGVLFLTTNRATAFDDAIQSRITVAISYPPLHHAQRLKIWQALLSRAGLASDDVSANKHLLLCHEHDLNGREIRNIVHIAQIRALSLEQPLVIDHILQAMHVFVAGIKELQT